MSETVLGSAQQKSDLSVSEVGGKRVFEGVSSETRVYTNLYVRIRINI